MNKMKLLPVLLIFSSSLLLSFCKNRPVLEKINCQESFEKITMSDTSSGRIGVIVKNIKKIPNTEINGELKNQLIASYISDKNTKIAYSTEFCTQYNALIDIINKDDADRRSTSRLSEKERAAAGERYTTTVDTLVKLLFNGLSDIINIKEDGEEDNPDTGIEDKDIKPVPPSGMQHVFIKASDFGVPKFDFVLENGTIVAKNRDVFDSHKPIGSVLTFKYNNKIIHQITVKHEKNS